MMGVALTTDIGDKIIKILKLPDKTINFSMHFPLDDAVTIKCEYYAEDKGVDGFAGELRRVCKKYRLEEIAERVWDLKDKAGCLSISCAGLKDGKCCSPDACSNKGMEVL